MDGHRRGQRLWIIAVVLAAMGTGEAPALTINVDPGESIQAAIVAATSGDVVMVAPGTYGEDIDFLGKAITVVGAGPSSVIRGTGTGPVVTIASAEGPTSVLDSFLITGGVADRGGGVFIQNSSPTILRNVIFENHARSQGSGVFIQASSAELYNNLIAYNRTALNDPHSLEIQDAAPRVVNNTVVRGDSNGVIVRGNSPAVVMNNIIALNGARIDSSLRGRGICDFSINDVAVIQYNVFWGNRVAALLTDGTDFRRIRRAQRAILPPRLEGNLDGSPTLARRRPPREPAVAGVIDVLEFVLGSTSRARDAGNPNPTFNDIDATRNDIGFTGGPFAPAL